MPYDVTVDLDGPARGRLEAAPLVAWCEEVLAAEGVGDVGLGLLFAGDALLWRLNREHRDIDEPTDVLSFPGDERERTPSPEGGPRYLGDIAVSVETVERQAAAVGLTTDEELRHVILHALLHLLGYDHETAGGETAMRRREEALLGPRIHGDGGAHAHHD